MVSTTTKLVIMGALAAVTIVLGTAVLTLNMILNQRKSAMVQRKKNKAKSLKFKDTKTPKTILSSIPPNSTIYNLEYKRHAHHSTDARTIANAEFAMALRGMPFESTGGYVDGNAYPIPENFGVGGYKGQNERGAEFVMGKKKRKKKGSTKVNRKNDRKNDDVAVEGSSSVGGEAQRLNNRGNQETNKSNWFDIEGVKKYLIDIVQNEDSTNDSFFAFVRAVMSDILHRFSLFAEERSGEDSYQTSSSRGGGESSSSSIQKRITSAKHDAAIASLRHLEKASEYGHSSAQNMIAISLASGIFPVDNHINVRTFHNTTNDLMVPSDFGEGGEQLARALTLWHLSAMDGNVEAAMALGFRHRFSAVEGAKLGGRMSSSSNPNQQNKAETMVTDDMVTMSLAGGMDTNSHAASSQHYGVLGTCESALAYYEAAANGIMDELEQSSLRGKVNPSVDLHHLAMIYMNGGASSALSINNKPDELEEALQYYRMKASRQAHPQPDVHAAFTLASFYHYGIRGARQDMKLALKYYEIAADYGSWEAAGQAGKFHLWSIGVEEEDRDLHKAYKLFALGTPGGLDGCRKRHDRKTKKHINNARNKNGEDAYKLPWEDDETDEEDDGPLCDHPCVNGMGLLHLFGVPNVIDVDISKARQWFILARDMGNMDASYNLGMLRLGWMAVTPLKEEKKQKNEERELKEKSSQENHDYRLDSDESVNDKIKSEEADTKKNGKDNGEIFSETAKKSANDVRKESVTQRAPQLTKGDYAVAMQEFSRAAAKGHVQAKHRLGMIYAHGVEISFNPPNSSGEQQRARMIAVQKNCHVALEYYKGVVNSGTTIARRNRVAYKQYMNGNIEDSLRNYMAAAETGSDIGQVNAAFLLESGHCLGMNQEQCMKASLRYWRAAARQGNEEACLRVGDFYYYGRINAVSIGLGSEDGEKDGNGSTSRKTIGISATPGPFAWTRYILYPEELIPLIRLKTVHGVRWLLSVVLSRGHLPSTSVPVSCAAGKDNRNNGVCLAEKETDKTLISTDSESPSILDSGEDENYNHLAIAADYYRMAAEEHKSSRANFNLGFMHEWGLGLTQDFPLAKRHYDLAATSESTDAAGIAVQLALASMNIHEKVVKYHLMWKEWQQKQAIEKGLWSIFSSSDVERATDDNGSLGTVAMMDLMILLLTCILFGLIGYQRRR